MPSHVAVILDGNRRWAIENGLPPWMGHRKGAEKVKLLLRECLKLGIKTLTVYAFSVENFQRSEKEIEEIMKIAEEKLEEILNTREIYENEVRVSLLGRRDLLPKSLIKKFDEVEEKTKTFNKHYLNIAMAYSGRVEIVDAVRKLVKDLYEGKIPPDQITEEDLEKRLYTYHLPNPYPDLIIRTSGEERLSGFLLWQSAYSELCFLEVYWPEFRAIDLYRAIRTYQRRNRRFGK